MDVDAEVDVAIVGAGPAGASTALHLARFAPALAGSTLLIERSAHPRSKLCGGGLVNDVDVVLRNLGLDLSKVPHADASWANLHYQGRGLRMQLGDIAFHVVRRADLDAWLASHVRDCGIQIRENTLVTNIETRADGIILRTNTGTIRARAVVGADGSKGMVRRMLPGGRGSVARLVEVVTPPRPPKGLTTEDALFEFRNIPEGIQGYSWSFPMWTDGKPMRNWGVYDSRLVGAPETGSLVAYLKEELARHGLDIADYKVEGHPLRLFTPGATLSTERIVLAGDSAGADPLLGEGISLALGYGELAAQAIVDAFSSGDFSFADYSQSVHRSPMGRSLRRRHLAARMVYGLRSSLPQQLIWWRIKPLLRTFIRRGVFSWATPTTHKINARARPMGPLHPARSL